MTARETPRPSTDGRPRRVALLVDDDSDFRESLAVLVGRENFDVRQASSLAEARDHLKEPVDVVFVDLGLPDGRGLDLLEGEPAGEARPEMVVITGNVTAESAVAALRQGVLDYLSKPVDRNRLRATLVHVERTRNLRSEVGELRDELRELGHFGLLVGRSAPMTRLFDLIERVAPTRVAVLVLGESGVGKELVAETLHRMSARARERFLAVNCGAVAPNVIESELFGHEKGSFTGADKVRRGYFEEASGGTLFLDEITEMSAELQVKLLRVLETGNVMRVGGSEAIPVDVRLIAASNRDPDQAVREGKLREDLYYRLNVFPILIPPLRERPEDIEPLAGHFLALFNEREGTEKRWSPDALRKLRSYAWPGNVRELRNVVDRAAILSEDVIYDTPLPQNAPPSAAAPEAGPNLTISLSDRLDEIERRVILATLRLTEGDKKETARRLGISLKTLYNRLNVYEAAGRMEPVKPGV
jgi:DNA-binding NtrC family response regulator